ncbi:MAG: 3-oxoacyl-ACP synthase III family protein [Bdellovibrionales bacterium]
MSYAYIAGTGLYAPEKIVKNQFFNELYKKDIDTFLREQRNIYERRWMNSNQSTSDLILPAAHKALGEAQISAANLDLIIIATDTPDYLSPSTAAVVQHKLQAVKAGTFDLNAACAGFVTALDTARRYIETDSQINNVLVVGAYAMSKWLNMEDYKIATLFADGAGAVVLKKTDKKTGVLAATYKSLGEFHDYMGIYAGGSYKPFNQDVLDKKEHLLSFPKRIPPETNGQYWPGLVKATAEKAGWNYREIDQFFITQFNVQSINETMDKLELPREKAHLIMQSYGYTGSASIGMCLADAVLDKKLKSGDKIMFVGSGGGLSMCAVAVEWSPH